jgi:Tfp pilus assembly protein PilF
MSVDEILQAMSKLTAAERAVLRQRLQELDLEGQTAALHEPSTVSPALKRVESQIKQLNKGDLETLRDWLENLLEDQLEVTEEFRAHIAQAEENYDARRNTYRRSLRAFFRKWDASRSVTVGERPSRDRTYGDNPRIR